MGPTWGPSGAERTQLGHMLAPWTFLSGVNLSQGISPMRRLSQLGDGSTLWVESSLLWMLTDLTAGCKDYPFAYRKYIPKWIKKTKPDWYIAILCKSVCHISKKTFRCVFIIWRSKAPTLSTPRWLCRGNTIINKIYKICNGNVAIGANVVVWTVCG